MFTEPLVTRNYQKQLLDQETRIAAQRPMSCDEAVPPIAGSNYAATLVPLTKGCQEWELGMLVALGSPFDR